MMEVIMVDGDWTLEKADWGEECEDGIIWARHYGCRADHDDHYGCRADHDDRYGRYVPDLNRHGQWTPRDNALAGKCCYCGDPVPEHFVTLYMMYNWDEIPNWGYGIK